MNDDRILPEGMYYYLDENHNVLPARTWGQVKDFFETDRKRVAYDEFGGVRVSTVFLPIDHSFRSEGPPVVFETMIFGDDKNLDYQTRCSTWGEAVKMHERAVRLVTEGK